MATQPLQSFPCLGALDVTAQLIPRDDSNRDASQRRSSLGWAFARESSIATAIVRKDCQASPSQPAGSKAGPAPLHIMMIRTPSEAQDPDEIPLGTAWESQTPLALARIYTIIRT